MKAWGSFLMLCLIYGSGYLFITIAVEQVSPLEMLAARMLIGSIGLLTTCWFTGQALPFKWHFIRNISIIGTGYTVIPSVMIATALHQGVGSGLAAVLIATMGLFSLIFSHFVFHDERITWLKTIGVLVGFSGVIILVSENLQPGSTNLQGLVAQGMMILSAMLFSLFGVFSRRIMQDNHYPPLVMATGTIGSGTMVVYLLLGIQTLFGNPPISPLELQTDTTLVLIELGIFQSFLTYIFMFVVIRELGVTRFSMYTYIAPGISLILGAVFLDEIIDLRIIVGAVLVIGSIGITSLPGWFQEKLHPAKTTPIIEESIQ